MERQLINKRSRNNNHRYVTMDSLYYLQQWEQIFSENETDISIVELDTSKQNDDVERVREPDVTFSDTSKREEYPHLSNIHRSKKQVCNKRKNENLENIPEELGKQELTFESCNHGCSRVLPENVEFTVETSDSSCKTHELNTKPRIVDVILIRMGSSMSSTGGDRRNNALRRSQRKSLTGTCSGIDKVLKALKNFKGTIDSEEYEKFKLRIIHIEKNMEQKVREVHPQFQTIHNIAQQKIANAYGILEQKARENTELSKTQNVILNGDPIVPSSPSTLKKFEEPSANENPQKTDADLDVAPPQSPNEGNKRNSLLLRLSKLTSPKKDSRSSASEAEVTEVTAEVHKSPEATRKSIMKYGVPVLPSPTSNGLPRIVSFNTPDDFDTGLMKHEKRLKQIKEDVANLEIRISEFVGKRDGRHYNNLKSALTQLVEELEQIDEDELLDQVVLCHNYIKSCFSFLDSKAVDGEELDDEVFTNYTDSKIYGSTHDLLEGHLVRTTAI